jgi:type II secretory pathway pseudopilin PulG
MKRKQRTTNSIAGITLVEIVIIVSIVGILALLVSPQISFMKANYGVRSCGTDLIENMRAARAMAIKENREYLIVFDTANQRFLIGFDGNDDNDLVTADWDTFGICKDTDTPPDRLPNGDTKVNGVPTCVRVINLGDCGNTVSYGTLATADPGGNTIPGGTLVTFSGTPPSADFNADGSAGKLGSVYLQQTTEGYSYVVIVSNTAGATSMFKWDGDKDNTGVTTWNEIR